VGLTEVELLVEQMKEMVVEVTLVEVSLVLADQV
jgi:hypothetical protein